mmetsp:Transcript_17817/g.54812  ORF Transcript_17817/g.54812 Transcript_17817/m.54812 type:complete len:234 (+) Transcript_17817:339-1040(+)
MHRAVSLLLIFCVCATRAFAPTAPTSAALARAPSRVASTRAVASPRARRTALAADPSFLTALGTDADVATLFNVVTFVPQPLWILMILSAAGVQPTKPLANAIMRPWGPVVAFSLCHVAIVIISATQPSGVAPIAEFNQVFDPTGFPFTTAPQAAMQSMMQYVNFVSEEWPHVLIWDLFVGRWIWLDGEKRGVFTPHSVLLTNLIGPPGLMLHFATCLLTGKGLPPTEDEAAA